jgi:hypothetical protein
VKERKILMTIYMKGNPTGMVLVYLKQYVNAKNKQNIIKAPFRQGIRMHFFT